MVGSSSRGMLISLRKVAKAILKAIGHESYKTVEDIREEIISPTFYRLLLTTIGFENLDSPEVPKLDTLLCPLVQNPT